MWCYTLRWIQLHTLIQNLVICDLNVRIFDVDWARRHLIITERHTMKGLSRSWKRWFYYAVWVLLAKIHLGVSRCPHQTLRLLFDSQHRIRCLALLFALKGHEQVNIRVLYGWVLSSATVTLNILTSILIDLFLICPSVSKHQARLYLHLRSLL